MNTRERLPDDQLIADLAGAVSRGEIAAHFQPQIDVGTGAIVAVESLSRWVHPDLGTLSPSVFIPLAEEFGEIDEIGEFMFRQACECAWDFSERELGVEVAVNVSALQLARNSFFEHVESELVECGVAPDKITLEITESRLIANRPLVAERLAHLRDKGIGVSIDDFGVGHSSVEQVLALPANELKIDRTIVQDETDGAGLLTTIIRLAKDRGLRTVAEGIETDAQLERVRALGCDRAQGYLLGRPMAKSDLDAVLSEQVA